MKRGRVIVSDAVHPLLIEGLQALGYECSYQPEVQQADLLAQMSDVVGLVINSKTRVHANFLAASPKLRFLARLGSGLEIIDLEAAARAQVAVYRSPEGNCQAVAEHALGFLLSLLNNMPRAHAQLRQKNWQREANRGRELSSMTVGILGFGYTGKAFATRLAALGAKVLVYDKYLAPGYAADYAGIEEASVEQIQAQANVLSLHLPLSAETIGSIDEKFLFAFAQSFYLINTSRGQVLPTRAILRALREKKLLGAALDVFENEKPETHSAEEEKLYEELFNFDNVLLSPHIAGWTEESKLALAQILLDKIAAAC